MDYGHHLNFRPLHRIFIVTAILACALSPHHAHAQNTSSADIHSASSILIPPQAPQTNFVINSSFAGHRIQYYADQVSQNFDASTQNLKINLNALAELNTKENQEALNALGTTYANLPSLGTDLLGNFNAESLSKISANAGELNIQLHQILGGYSQAMEKITIDNTLPKDQMLAAAQKSGLVNATGVYIYGGIANNNISALNANLESLIKTYRNLLQLSSQSPSTLVAMPNLQQQLNALDNLAGQIGGLPGIGDKLDAATQSIKNFQDGGGLKTLQDPDPDKSNAANTALGNFNTALDDFSAKTFQLNAAAATTLGSQGSAVPVYDTMDILNSANTNTPRNTTGLK